MLAPHPPTIRELAQREGIPKATLYNWRNQLRKVRIPVNLDGCSTANWTVIPPQIEHYERSVA